MLVGIRRWSALQPEPDLTADFHSAGDMRAPLSHIPAPFDNLASKLCINQQKTTRLKYLHFSLLIPASPAFKVAIHRKQAHNVLQLQSRSSLRAP